MNKKSVILSAGAISIIAIPSCCGAKKQASPNIVIIHCDQLAAWPLGCYGGDEVGTPNIDGLAAEGVVMTNFYANTPVSTPSRGCMMSGLYPNEHGAYKNDMQIRQDIPTFASELRDAGYQTGYCGKWHLDGNPKRPGWDIRGADMGWSDRSAMYAFGHYKTITDDRDGYPVFSNDVSPDAEHYPTDWFTSKAIEFIDAHRKGPFCVMLSIPDPHAPYLVREPYASMYAPEKMKIPDSFIQEPRNDNFLYWESREKADKKSGKTEYETIRENLRFDKSQYFGEIKCIDDNVGKVVNYLKKKRLYDNTIIVFTADHGDMMGEHARMAKAVPFESAARIPMIIRFPHTIAGGQVCRHVASMIDFYPTILSLAGVQRKGSVSGKDMSALFGAQAQDGEWREVAFLRSYSQNYPWICAVTPTMKLIYGEKDAPGEGLLLDRAADPEESLNYFHDPKYADVVSELSRQIKEYCIGHNDPHWTWLKDRIK